MLVVLSFGVIATFTRDSPSEFIQANDKSRYRIVGKFPRANGQLFFTEGLSFIDSNTLMESTGLYGDSEIHLIEDVKVNLYCSSIEIPQHCLIDINYQNNILAKVATQFTRMRA